MPADLPPGRWVLDVHYANGNGPVNTEDKAALRTLLQAGRPLGVVVMPQRGNGQWSAWGWSNAIPLDAGAGARDLRLVYTPLDANMNRRENTALVDIFRFTRLATDSAAARPARRHQPSRTP